jgi:hypothetical protein
MASALMVGDELDSGQLQAPYGFLRDGSSYHPAQPLDDNSKRQRFAQWVGTNAGAPGSFGLAAERRPGTTIAAPGAVTGGIDMNAP